MRYTGHQVSLNVGPYDRGKELAIDPVLVYATLVGGAGDGNAAGIAVDAAVQRDLEQLEIVDEQNELVIDPRAVAAALEKPKQDSEPEVRFMRMARGNPAPAYDVQTAVDAEHLIIAAQQVTTEATDNRSLLPMSEAAKEALDNPDTLNVVADATTPTESRRRAMWGAGHRAARARQPLDQQPRRWHVAGPQSVHLRRQSRHFSLSCG